MLFLAFAAEAAPVPCNFHHANGRYGGRVTAEYISPTQAAADEAKQAAAEMRPPGPTPPAGLLIFRVYRVAIEMADASMYVVVLERGGVEVLREEPEPRMSSGHATLGWTNSIAVEIPPGDGPLDVHVGDRVYASRCDWRLGEGGLVKVK